MNGWHDISATNCQNFVMPNMWTRSNRDHLIVTRLTKHQGHARSLMLHGYDVDEIARIMGKSKPRVWNLLRCGCWKRVEAERLGHGTHSANYYRCEQDNKPR